MASSAAVAQLSLPSPEAWVSWAGVCCWQMSVILEAGGLIRNASKKQGIELSSLVQLFHLA